MLRAGRSQLKSSWSPRRHVRSSFPLNVSAYSGERVARSAAVREHALSIRACASSVKFAARTGTRYCHAPSPGFAASHGASAPISRTSRRSGAATDTFGSGRGVSRSSSKASYHAAPVPRNTLPTVIFVQSGGIVTFISSFFQPNVPFPALNTRLSTSLFFSWPAWTYQPAEPFTPSARTITRSVMRSPGRTGRPLCE